MTAREAILEALAILLGSPPGATFFRSRESAVAREEGTVITLRPEEEEVEKRASFGDIVLRDMIVVISVIARGDIPDQTADPTIQWAHAAVMADPTLGNLCSQIIEQSTKWTLAMADSTAVEAELRYRIRYMTRARDLVTPQ